MTATPQPAPLEKVREALLTLSLAGFYQKLPTPEQAEAGQEALSLLTAYMASAASPAVPEEWQKAFIKSVVRSVAELPGRTSPEEAPWMMMVTSEELTAILEYHLAAAASPAVPDESIEEEFDTSEVAEAYRAMSAASPAVPEGFVIVPRVPTPKMLEAAFDPVHAEIADQTWEAMIDAAPLPPAAAPAVPEGHWLAPNEPTEEMAQAGLEELQHQLGDLSVIVRDPVFCFRAMRAAYVRAAAPPPHSQEGG